MANVTYNRVIRKLVIGFGNLFDEITLVRYNPNNTEAERFIVPIAYSAKELYFQRLLFDPENYHLISDNTKIKHFVSWENIADYVFSL